MRGRRVVAILVVAAAVLAGCASGPRGGGDGPPARPPSNLATVPDAQPRLEPIRVGGPNKPYEVMGRRYTPMTQDRPLIERGLASWYGRKFHGRRTANGEIYDMYAMTAAHKTMPLPSYARVRNPANGREVIVRINDRGPFHPGRIIDLSYTAALKLGVLNAVAPVEVERITFEDIRTGAWRRDGSTALASAAPSAPAVDSPPPTVVATATVPPPVVATTTPAGPVAVEATDGSAATPADDAGIDDIPLRPLAAVERGFWIQLGAFRQREGAESFMRRVAAEVEWLAPMLGLFGDASLMRLQAGPFATREDARAGAERIREALQLVPMIVERR